MYQRILRRLSLFGFSLLFVAAGVSAAYGKKPPWAGGPGDPGDYDPPPVSAPEPMTISLIATGLAGAAGYYLANKKRRK